MTNTNERPMSSLFSSNRIPKIFTIVSVILVLLAMSMTSSVQAQGSDADGDGIPDTADSCPSRGNEGGAGIDGSGCPYYDADGDGVYDRNDSCPWRADEYGFGVGGDGCPLTGEVATEEATENPTDTEPGSETPPDTQTPPPSNNNNAPSNNNNNSNNSNNQGEPAVTEDPFATEEATVTEEVDDIGQARDWIRDADGDGLADVDDACPWLGNEGGLGVDETGCPYYDTDWDGFVDRIDACPWRGNEGGLGVDFTGCPYYDADWDGFYDRDDACPWRGDEYGYGIDDVGCPLVAPEVTPEITPEVTPEITPEVTPEITEEPPVDSDGDGIFDDEDLCPDEGDAGYGLNSAGCPLPDPGIIIEGIDIAGCLLDDDDVDFTCLASSVCDGVIAELGFDGDDDSCVTVALTFIDDYEFPVEPTATAESGDSSNPFGLPAMIISLLIALVSYITNYIQEQIQQAQLRQELEGFGFLTDLVNVILSSWSPAQIMQLINSYLPTMSNTIGYSLAEIENILETALESTLYNFFDLDTMLDEIMSDTGDDDLYIWDMNDPVVPHLFPPNEHNRPIVFNIHGWNVQDEGATNAYSNNASWFDNEFSEADPIIIGIDWEAFLGDILNTVVNYNNIETIARLTGETLGTLIEAYQNSYPNSTIATIAHSMGNQLFMSAVENADINIDMYVGVQPAVGRYEPLNGLIDDVFDDVLNPDEVEQIRITYNERDAALRAYTFSDILAGEPDLDFAIGTHGLWEYYFQIPNVTFVGLQTFDNVENYNVDSLFYLPWQYTFGHQSIEIPNTNDQVQTVISNAMQDFLGIA